MSEKKPIKKTNKNKAGNSSVKEIVLWTVIAVIAVAVIVLAIVNPGSKKSDKDFTSSTSTTQTQTEEPAKDNTAKEYEIMATEETVKVNVEMENGENFVMELYPEYAPQTVQNFVDLVNEGFYDGVGFHRVVDGFMAQGGDPEGTGMGGSGTNIPGEFAANGFAQNTISHQRGVISMARSQDMDSASSQFFICYDDASFLDGQYAAFGKVIEGMEVVDAFLDVERTPNAMGEMANPVEPITMKTVTIIED